MSDRVHVLLENLAGIVEIARRSGWKEASVFCHDANNLVIENVETKERLYCWADAAVDVSAGKGLSAQEVRVLECMTEGKPNKQIAAILFISDQTVKGYVHSILQKLGVSNRTHAVSEGLRHGLVH